MICTDCRHVIDLSAESLSTVIASSAACASGTCFPEIYASTGFCAPLMNVSLRLARLICCGARAILHELLGQLVSDFWSLKCYHGTSGQYADAHGNLVIKISITALNSAFQTSKCLSSDTCHAHFDRGWSSSGHQHRQRSCTKFSCEMTVITPTKPMPSIKCIAETSAALLFGAALLLSAGRHSRPLYGTRPPQ